VEKHFYFLGQEASFNSRDLTNLIDRGLLCCSWRWPVGLGLSHREEMSSDQLSCDQNYIPPESVTMNVVPTALPIF
jgi:hypothetical protein